MDSIKQPVYDETEIKHSRFLTVLAPVFSKDEAEHMLARVKNEHPDASHHCFAYIIGDDGRIQKAEDDGEPAKTAGVPMLRSLEKNNLTNILAVVVRYFGGVKLGAGGLIRAYGKSVSDAIEKAVRTTRTVVVRLHIKVSFDAIGTIEHLLSDWHTPIERSFDTAAHFELSLKEADSETLRKTIREKTRNQALVTVKTTTVRYL